jgi:hypothetical protein
MAIVLTIVVVVLVFPYVAGPLFLWFSGSRIPPTNVDVVAATAPMPMQAESHFWKTTHFFAANGFERAGDRVRERNRSGLAAYKQLWRNLETGETALVGAFVKESDAEFSNTFVAFMHEYGDDALLSTSNFNPGARTLLDPAGTSKVVVASQDIAELRALHNAHVAEHGASGVRPLRARDALALSKQLEAASRATALAKKRFRKDGDSLRITFWGAVSSIWINLPPLKGKYDQQEREAVERLRLASATSAHNRQSRAA